MSTHIDHENVENMHDRDLSSAISHLGDLISKLAKDLGTLVTLQKELLKAELKESTSIIARQSVMLAIGGVLGLFALMTLTLAILFFIAMALPWAPLLNLGVAAAIVFVVYAVIGGLLVMMGIKKLNADNLKPDRSIKEIKRDSEMVKELKN